MYLASLLSPSLRRFAQASLFFLAVSPAALLAQSNTSTDGYDPNVDGNVYAFATQADGRLIIGGAFSSLQPNGSAGPLGRGNIARLNGDGTADLGFSPNANGAVNTIVVQSDGKILIGGAFTSLQPDGTASPVARNRIARLNSNGTVDVAFNPSLGDQMSDVQVYALALQADGKILVGGTFTSKKPTGAATGLARERLLRLNADGSLDATFVPNPDNAVFAIAIQPLDNRILIGGSFANVAGTARNRIARLNLNGSIDGGFDPNANNTVSALLVLPNNQIMVGGTFTTFQANGADSVSNHVSLARVNVDGTLDSSFAGGANGQVFALALQRDGKLLVGGAFKVLWPASGTGNTETRQFIGRFNVDSSLDSTFVPSPNLESGHVRAILAQGDGSVVFGGLFTQIKPPTAAFATTRSHIARVYSNGIPDVSLDLGTGGGVLSVAQQTDGKFVVGGTFNTVGGATRNFLARINADGTLDTSFNPTLNNRVSLVMIQPSDGKILIAGQFTTVEGAVRNFFARLNSNGTLDTGFDPGLNNTVNAIAVQADGKILIGGAFTALNPNAGTTATARTYLARLNSDGTLDTGYTAVANQPVLALKFQSDGKLIVAGSFNAIQPNGTTTATGRNAIARLNADGTLDAGYNPNPNNAINALAIQSDGKVIAGGGFTQVQPNGAATATLRNRIARFNTDGTVDTAFNPDANAAVAVIAIQADGKILVSGGLTSIAGHTLPTGFGRINADGTSDFTFEPNPNGRALVFLPFSDGKILLGGTFTTLQPNGTGNPVQVSRLARINGNGTYDATFVPAIGGLPGAAVNTIALQADGRFLVGGSFSNLGGSPGSGVARFYPDGVADFGFAPTANGQVRTLVVRPDVGSVVTQGNGFGWINSDGTLRSGFNSDPNARLVGDVKAILRHPNGGVFVGGQFTNSSGVTGSNFARFNADGSLDAGFNPNPNGIITTIVLQPSDNKIIVGGTFTTIAGTTRNRIVRFNANGTIDDSFDPNLSGGVDTIVVQADGKILVGGGFTTVQPNAATSATIRPYIARLNTDGTVDTGFNPQANNEVFSIAVQSDNKVLLGGTFSAVNGTGSTTSTSRLNIARVNADGTIDTGFDPNHGSASGPVFSIVVQSDSKIVIGGSFGAVGGFQRNNIARMQSDGNLDTTFEISANSSVSSLALQTDGKILVGGVFTSIAGLARNHIARLNSDSSIDTSFNPNANGQVNAIALQSDGSILLGGAFSTLQPGGAIVAGGSFTNIGGAVVSNLALLNDDGTANSGFKPNPDGAVNAAVVQTDGKVVVGGEFTALAGGSRNRIARFNSDGSLDSVYNPNLNGTVLALALQSDGKILVGGDFTTAGGAGRPGIARLNSNGSVDSGFNPPGGLGANALAVQADGKILVVRAGSGVRSILSRLNSDGSADATFVTQSNADLIATVALQADGRPIVGGAFTTFGGVSRNRVARLNTDGTVDASFNPDADSTVNAIALQADGKAIIGGAFGRVSGNPRVRVARISNSTPAVQVLVATTATAIAWNRGGSSPELSSATFEVSSDARSWSSLGIGTRIPGTSNWGITFATALPANSAFYIRARGVAPTSQGGSAGLVEQSAQLYLNPLSGFSSAPIAAASTDRSFLYAVGATNNPISYSATGLPDGLSIDPLTGIISGRPRQSGLFNVTLAVTNAGGTTTQGLALNVTPGTGADVASSGHLLDISCLAHVDSRTPLITGFVITGNASKSVLLRAIGPGLMSLGVAGVLPSPRLQLYSADGRLLLDNNSWGGEMSLAGIFLQAGEFALDPSSSDAAAAVTLAPGGYTVVVSDDSETGSGGLVLSEIYDVAGGAQQFAAMSARGHVISGGSLTGGFVVTGDIPRRFLVRGVGPALATYGVTDSMPDPKVTVNDMQGREFARNDNWETPLAGGASGAEIAAAAASVGNYAFPSGSKDAALIVTLAPGIYTAQVTGNGSSAGSSVIEIYELP